MELQFIKVTGQDKDYINEVYKILKKSGEYMFKEKGLTHWKKTYSKENIVKDVNNKKVFVVKELIEDSYVCTFQLDIKKDKSMNKVVEINKFATEPRFMGQGIGTESIEYIEDICKKLDISILKLEVYNKSSDSIQFYKSKGFYMTGKKHTTNFVVELMEKVIF